MTAYLRRGAPRPRAADMRVFATGLNHKTAPVAVRERLAVKHSELANSASTLKSMGSLDEIVLVSTCNRVEIFGATETPTSHIQSLMQALCSEPCELKDRIYVHEGIDAIRHLFRVTSGLDSMVLGETEITGQIKKAYEIARAAHLTGRVLNRLFQTAFHATKEIRTWTGIGRGTVSVKSAVAELAERVLGDDLSRSIMVLGAGQMAECCVRLLRKKGARSILIANRSFDRALDLAVRSGGQAICLGDCLFGMRDVDLVIAATSSPETLLGREDLVNLMKARYSRPLLLIDLSVPRNIGAGVRDLEGVSLYDIDDLEALARDGVRSRERELDACNQIIEAHAVALADKLQAEDLRHSHSWRPSEVSTASAAALQAA
jgi:glutamyl-tRNA reductase